MSSYRVAPVFLIRTAGLPFEALEQLSTSRAAAAARELLVRQSKLEKSKGALELLFRSGEHGLSEESVRAWRKAAKSGSVPPETEEKSAPLAEYSEQTHAMVAAESMLKQALDEELDLARSALLKSSRELLPPYLVFGAGDFRDRLDEEGEGAALPPRNSRARERERHLLLYVQRLCAKNDTFSRFGPSAWGHIANTQNGLNLGSSGIARRAGFFERWTAHTVAAALNQDPDTRAEIAPRLNPNGILDESSFFLSATNERLSLDPETAAALRRCDGKTTVKSLGIPWLRLEELAREKIILWEIEVPALEPYAFAEVMSDLEQWGPGAVRDRWLDLLSPLAALPTEFEKTEDVSARIEIMAEARRRLTSLGGEQKSSERHLYSAANPIAEECFRSGDVALGQEITDQFIRDAEPWIDLWRDTYAYVASRVSIGLRGLLESVPGRNGAVPLPAFLQHCAANQLPLERHGAIVFAAAAFQEVKSAFRQKFADRADASEWELSANDCHFVRNNFEYPKFDEYTYPSADIQISARSLDAIAVGDFQWVLAELHPPPALMHHCFFWSCPDQAALSSALASTTFGKPNFHFGFFAADFTAHTTVRLFDALPEHSNFVAPQRGNPKWKTVRPADAEVYLDERTGDVCLRERTSKKHLGSFARAWLIPLGFHPFHFGRTPHLPRLRCGKVIVQRESWTVALSELRAGNFTGVSRDLVLAIEQLRGEKGWPRHIYIRPTEQALRRSGAEGRDKDTKPVFIDLESYLSLEIFHRWLSKSGELEVTEMLPDPDHLCWQEADGRRTFELRTLIVPRS